MRLPSMVLGSASIISPFQRPFRLMPNAFCSDSNVSGFGLGLGGVIGLHGGGGEHDGCDHADDAAVARRLPPLALVLDSRKRAAAAWLAGMDRQALRDWAHRYNADGMAGLVDRHGGGVARRLSAEQEAEVAGWMGAGPDLARTSSCAGAARTSRRGLPSCPGSSCTVGKLLHRLRFSPARGASRRTWQHRRLSKQVQRSHDRSPARGRAQHGHAD